MVLGLVLLEDCSLSGADRSRRGRMIVVVGSCSVRQIVDSMGLDVTARDQGSDEEQSEDRR